MIASAYEAGIEFFIQKPINSVEVEAVIKKVSDGLSMKRMVRKMQNIFMEDTSPATVIVPDNSEQIENSLRTILTRIGIIGDIGSKDIISIVKYLVDHQDHAVLRMRCSIDFGVSQKRLHRSLTVSESA